jgi:hypothetical protein
MNPRVTWPLALLFTALIAGATVILAMGKPVTELTALANLLIMALLYGEVQQVRQQTNGTQHRMMSIVERASIPQTGELRTVSVDSGADHVHEGQSQVDRP